MPEPNPIFRTVKEARREILDADVLLFRGTGLCSRLIQIGGRSRFSHAGMATWWGSDLFCCEMRSRSGGRAVLLASQVRLYPAAIDVFQPQPALPDWARNSIARAMRRQAGQAYSFAGIQASALLHLPFLRWFATADQGDGADYDRENWLPKYCSHAVAYSFRVGGSIDLVPQMADAATEPGDLARSALLKYAFTLVP